MAAFRKRLLGEDEQLDFAEAQPIAGFECRALGGHVVDERAVGAVEILDIEPPGRRHRQTQMEARETRIVDDDRGRRRAAEKLDLARGNRDRRDRSGADRLENTARHAVSSIGQYGARRDHAALFWSAVM